MATANRKAAPRRASTPGDRDNRQAPGRLAPGTLCFLTRVKGDQADVMGRVVEVVMGPRAKFGRGPGIFYEVTAPWLLARFPQFDVMICRREQLIPITPDEPLESDSSPATIDMDARVSLLAERLREVNRFCERIGDHGANAQTPAGAA